MKKPAFANVLTNHPKPLLSIIGRIYGASLLITAIALAFILAFYVPQQTERTYTQISEAESSALAERVAQNIRLTQSQLTNLLHGSIARNAIELGTPEALSSAQEQIASAFPEALSVQLIKLDDMGTSAMMAGTEQLRNHIEVDLIRRAQLKVPAPEAYIVDQQSLVSFAVASDWTTANGNRGVALLTRSESYYRALLTPPNTNSTPNLILGQIVRGASGVNNLHPILNMGNLNAHENAIQTRPISASEWELRYAPSALTYEQLVKTPWGLYFSLFLLTLCVVVPPWYLLAQSRKNLQRSIDQILLADATHSSPRDVWPELQPLIARMSNSNEARSELAELDLPDLSSAPTVPSFIKAAAVPKADDGISAIMEEVRNRRHRPNLPLADEVSTDEEAPLGEAATEGSMPLEEPLVPNNTTENSLEAEMETMLGAPESPEIAQDHSLNEGSTPHTKLERSDPDELLELGSKSVETDTVAEGEFDLSAFASDDVVDLVSAKAKDAEPTFSVDADLDELGAETEGRASNAQKQTRTVTSTPQAGRVITGEARQLAIDELPEQIFRAYDIRGVADTELTNEVVTAIGGAIATTAADQGEYSLIVGCDGRLSSPRIKAALIKSLLASGIDIIDIGIVPSPVMYFATHELECRSGLMITGSHNDAEINGIKIVLDRKPLASGAIQSLYTLAKAGVFSGGQGSLTREDVIPSYLRKISDDILIPAPLKIVIDASNGVAGRVAPLLFEQLGCDVVSMNCDIDGNFPNHSPDTSNEENLVSLAARVKREQADLGVAFDGDGDRIAAVDSEGNVIRTDRLMMVLARDVLSRNPGSDVVYDIKCSHKLGELISRLGGRPVLWKTGHALMKQKMRETGAILGGEFSGHIFFSERWYGFDDGVYAAARLAEIISTDEIALVDLLADFPKAFSTPELLIPVSDADKFELVESLRAQNEFNGGKITTIDGLRVDYAHGWGLVRASNTGAALTLRFEADSLEQLNDLQSAFSRALLNLNPNLLLPF
jgi:phosphomannomutase